MIGMAVWPFNINPDLLNINPGDLYKPQTLGMPVPSPSPQGHGAVLHPLSGDRVRGVQFVGQALHARRQVFEENYRV